MLYKEMTLDKKDIALYLGLLKDKDYLFFYNPKERKYIIGMDRAHKALKKEQVEYSFSAIPFFPESATNLWKDFIDESVAYASYIIIEDKCATLHYCDKPLVFSCEKVIQKKHVWQNKKDDYKEWCQLFNTVKDKIDNGEVEKVVLSREIEITCESVIDEKSMILNLLKNNTDSYVFAYRQNGKTFLGATPEVLVEKKGDVVTSYALAGTIAKNGIDDRAQGKTLLKDEKNRYEHKIVIDTIKETMKKITDKVDVEETKLMELKNLFHLKTVITAKDNTLSIIEWAKLLHPTPAMGGKPKQKAMAIIKTHEKHDRGLFAAPIGVVNRNGDGIYVVGIRSALIENNKIYAYAGCGVVKQSNCREEYKEINNKLQTILECL